MGRAFVLTLNFDDVSLNNLIIADVLACVVAHVMQTQIFDVQGPVFKNL